ncbi:hypothetical protein [Desulfatiglans anilini]|uniref:hypothetical protein n=1 Tax=Desulfatiglans anilini TaxID=90728 RepID=UPI000420B466|nr:hypothetical protein [Desulfatiglans anilini]
MAHERVSQSLLPYLDAQNTSTMRLEFVNPAVPESLTGAPFSVFDDSRPFARLFEARFILDEGTEIKRLLLLVQRDRCLAGEDPVRPLSNPDIDRLWLTTYAHYRPQGRSAGLTVLGSQLDASQRFMPLRPLFFCQKQRTFFHPPCPTCGALLDLCRDDSVLRGMGLSPYSGSLSRYLHCPACLQETGRTAFYAPMTDPADPLALKDGRALIRGFAQQAGPGGEAAAFPCRGCPDASECYGPSGLAVTRVVPFAFFPFFMLVFDAPSLSLIDFSALLGGAPPDDLERQARERGDYRRLRPFQPPGIRPLQEDREAFLFPDGSPRRFAEVLYLKLGLLEACLRLLRPHLEASGASGTDFSFDRLWVDLPGSPGHLPLGWSFNLRSIGMVSSRPPLPLPLQGSAATGLQLLGLVWFQILLANRRQKPQDIYTALQEALQTPGAGPDEAFPAVARNHPDSVFSPRNIFWNRESAAGEAFTPWWERSLGIGWGLLRNSAAGAVEAALEGIERTLGELRQEIKIWMFQPEARPSAGGAAVEGPGERPREDEAIYRLLQDIKAEWTARAARERPQPWETEPPSLHAGQYAAETLAGTVVLSAAAEPSGSVPPEPPLSAEGELQSTMIIGPDNRPEPAVYPPGDRMEQGQDSQPATVVLSPDGPPDAPQPAGDRPGPAARKTGPAPEVLEETVVIGRNGAPPADDWNRLSGAAAGGKPEAAPSAGATSEDDDLMIETVILRRDET